MGLEYIVQPQVFLGGLTALGPGIQNLTENYPLLTTYNYWTSTATVPTCAFPIPDAWSIYDGPNNSGSFIISVGGVIQPAYSYTIDPLTRTLMFNSLVSADIEVAGTQLATAAPSSQQFSYIKVLSGEFLNVFATDLSATNVSIISTYLDTTIFSYTAITTATYLSANDTIIRDRINVLGLLLSGGNNLFDIFTANTDFATITATLLPITTLQNLSGNWETTYQTVCALSAAWEESSDITPLTTILQSNSGNWTSAYTTVQTYSGSWEESSDILPTVTNYLSTELVTVSSLNVTKQILSASADLFEIFLTPNNTLTTSVCAMSGNGVTPFLMNFTNGLLTSLTV